MPGVPDDDSVRRGIRAGIRISVVGEGDLWAEVLQPGLSLFTRSFFLDALAGKGAKAKGFIGSAKANGNTVNCRNCPGKP